MDFGLKSALIGLIFISMGCAGPQPATQTDTIPSSDTDRLLTYQNEIQTDFLKKHLSAFAADSMEGRETGTEGLEKAADYLVSQYSEMGLRPVGDDGTYFQNFKLNATVSDSIVFTTYALKDGEKTLFDRSVASKRATANYIRGFGGTDTLSGEIVFAGFGVNDAARNIQHLEGSDLKGKWVMVFQEIPHVVQGDTLVDPAVDNQSRFQEIIKMGAEGILIIPEMSSKEYRASARQAQASFGEPSNMRLAYRDDGSGSAGGFAGGYNVINSELAAKILNVDSIETYKEKIIEEITDFKPQKLDYRLSHIPYSSEITLETQNIAAFHEGVDPELKDEVVVVTSHYDHLGIGQPDSTGDRIYNGADDDGSGTIGLLNFAEALTQAADEGLRPKRSILFLNVSAEEKGLLGSRYYSDHPIFPMEKTVANINTDMIGRVDEEHEKKGIEEYTYIIGSEIISSELDSLIKVANSRSGQLELDKKYNDLEDPNQFYRRSDHWHFGRKGVPFAFFFTGVHEDYHQPSDEVHKIRFEKMAKIVRTMYASTIIIANTDHPPTVDNQEFIEITKGDN